MSNQFIFDPNQTEFPTKIHGDIWYRASKVLPEEVSLSDKVKSLMSAELFESCKQLRAFVMHLIKVLYDEAHETYQYNYSPYTLDFMKFVDKSEEDASNGLIFDISTLTKKMQENLINEFEKNAVKFGKIGMKIENTENYYIVTNTLYPKMFLAMKALRNLKTSNTAIFYNCDFRKLCPDYKREKDDAKTNMPPCLTIEEVGAKNLSGENLKNFSNFVAWLRENKFNIKNTSSIAWAVTSKGKTVCYVLLSDKEKWGVRTNSFAWYDEYDGSAVDDDMKNFIHEKIRPPYCRLAGRLNCPAPNNVTILGKHFEHICACWPIFIENPSGEDLENFKKLVLIIRENIINMPKNPTYTKEEMEERFNTVVTNLPTRGEAVDIDLAQMSAEEDVTLSHDDGQLSAKNANDVYWRRVNSAEKFTGFVKIEGCVKTNRQRNAIRIRYGNAQLLLPMKIKSIKFYEPESAKNHDIAIDSKYTAGEFYEFEWYIGATFMAITINGEFVHYSESYEYIDKLADAELPAESVSVVPAPNSTTTVEWLRVTEI